MCGLLESRKIVVLCSLESMKLYVLTEVRLLEVLKLYILVFE